MRHNFHSHLLLSCLCAAAVLLSCTGCGNSIAAYQSHTSLSLDSSSGDSSTIATGTTTASSSGSQTTTTRTSTSAQSKTSTTQKTTAATNKSASSTTAAKSASQGSSSSGSNSGSNSSSNSNSNASANADTGSDSDTSAQQSQDSSTQQEESQQAAVEEATQEAPTPATDPVEEDSTSTEEETETEIVIALSGSYANTTDSSAVAISGSTVTIQQGGRYLITGSLSDGQIIVNVSKEEKVNLHFNGVDITCSTSAPLYVLSADTCTVHLDEGSVNILTDSASNSASACLFSKDDLTIKGKGSLIVNGNCKHGIKSNNDLKIKNGNLTVYSVNAALYGEDSIQITGGSITVPSSKDGFKVSNTEDSAKGFFYMEDGYIDVQNASGNGIEAITGVTISGGIVNLHTAKTAVKCDYQTIADNCLYIY